MIGIFDPERASPPSPWVLPVHDMVNCSFDMAFEGIVKNRDTEKRSVSCLSRHKRYGRDVPWLGP